MPVIAYSYNVQSQDDRLVIGQLDNGRPQVRRVSLNKHKYRREWEFTKRTRTRVQHPRDCDATSLSLSFGYHMSPIFFSDFGKSLLPSLWSSK